MRRSFYHIIALLATAACAGYELVPPAARSDTTVSALAAPVLASAGADREITRGYPTCLDGRGTSHPLGLPFTVRWDRLEGEPVYLSNATDLSPCFVAPLDEQELVFRLTADDGSLRTTDEVSLFVRKSPERVAPRIRAGADRCLGSDEAAEATADDTPDDGDEVTARWERITPPPSPAAKTEAEGSAATATVFRLNGERGGLRSAPDYLVLWKESEPGTGARAPVAVVEAPQVAEPGATIVLDANGSVDANGDTPRWRWEQTRGDPVQLLRKEGGLIEVAVSRRPQKLVFRVFARDERLESAPADTTVIVTPGNGKAIAPTVNPELDRTTHADNWVQLDALGAGPSTGYEPEDFTFTWEQTHGPPLDVQSYGQGRFAIFQAPASLDRLAFAVVASDGAAVSAPAVVRVDVVDAAQSNAGPDVRICVSTHTPTPGQWTYFTASALDPEGDPLLKIHWSTPTPEISIVAAESTGDNAPTLICDRGSPHVAQGISEAPGLAVSQVGLFAPDAPGQAFTVLAQACDELAACSVETVEMTTAAGD